VVEVAQALNIRVDDGDPCPQAEGDLRRVCAYDPAADNDHTPRPHPRHPAQQDSAPSLRLFQVVGADLHGHTPPDLAHRREEGEGAVGELHCLVSEGRHLPGYQFSRQRLVSSQMEISEQEQTRPHVAILHRLGLLHFQDHLRPGPHLGGRVHDLGATAGIVIIAKAAGDSSASLDEDTVAATDERFGTAGRERDTVLVILDLSRNANDHRCPLDSALGDDGVVADVELREGAAQRGVAPH